MAYTATVDGKKVIVQMGDGAGPEVFATICGVTEKGLEQTANVTETTIWDCTDVTALPQVVRDVQTKDWSISISGQIDVAGVPLLDAAIGVSKNYRFVFKDTGGVNKYKQAPGIMTSLTWGATNGEKASFSATISGNGALGALTANV